MQAANYNYNDLPVCAELPTSLKPEEVVAEASWTYKGKTHPLEVTMDSIAVLPSVITLRAVVPPKRGPPALPSDPRRLRNEIATTRLYPKFYRFFLTLAICTTIFSVKSYCTPVGLCFGSVWRQFF